MRANPNRAGRLGFDRLVDEYDAHRPQVPWGAVAEICRMASLGKGSRVLDVGAGTGQLTFPLRRAGLDVTALEPGAALAGRLREHAAGDGNIAVETDLFEDCPQAPESFDAVWSANAFHWVDPAVSYAKAARLLRPGGHLVLLWTHPLAADASLQRRLNEAFAEVDPNFVRDSDTWLETTERSAAEGRAELARSGHFEPPWGQVRLEPFEQDVDGYLGQLCSYGQFADRSPVDTEAFRRRIRSVLREAGVDRVAQTLYVAVCLARSRARSAR